MNHKLAQLSNTFSVNQLSPLCGQKIIIPLYHTIGNSQEQPQKRHLYDCRDTNLFEEDLKFFLSKYQPISLEEIIKHDANKTEPDKLSFHITFDDGLRSVYEIAAPILSKYGVQASCYFNNDFIDNKGLFYRYKVSLLIEHLFENKESLKSLNFDGMANSFEDLKKWLLSLKSKDENKIDKIALDLEYDFEDFLLEQKPYMTHDQIKKWLSMGFGVGAHSTSHAELEDLSEEDAIEDCIKSIEDIQAKYNLPYKAFAVPFTDFGLESKFFRNLKAYTDISFGTAGLKNREFGFHHHRIPMEESNLSAENIIKAELLYYVLKIPFGKNRIQRK